MKTLTIYSRGVRRVEYSAATIKKLARSKTFFWLDLVDPKLAELEELAAIFDIHHLVVEDILHKAMRPKIEEYKKHVFMVTYGVTRNSTLHTNEIDIVLGKNFVITAHKKPVESYEPLFRSKDKLTRLMRKGPDFLVHALIDVELDDTMQVLDGINDEVTRLEDRVLKESEREALSHILRLKRALLHIRKTLVPQREMISKVTKHNVPLICDECVLYFRDLYDHMILTIDAIDSQREILNNILEVHLSMTSNRMNEIMKVLTIIATIMLPVTAIGSIYGMNFKNMPELYYPNGYFYVLGLMGLIVVGMLVYFKRKKWL